MDLLDALNARQGIVCAVGAGGKKSTLYRLLEAHGGRVGITASAMTAPPSARRVDERIFTAGIDELIERLPAAAREYRRIAFALESEKSGRVAGLPPERIAECHEQAGFDVTLVKADGARMRGIKAPRHDEPLIVPGSATVIHIVSAAVIGQPLTQETAHRLPELCELLEAEPGDRLTPAHIGRLISHPNGGARGTEGLRHISLINQVDNQARAALALEAAEAAMQGTAPPDRVVLGSMRAENPVVEIVGSTPGEAN